MVKQKIYRKQCKCGKIIESIYPKQFEWNWNAHARTCEKARKEEVNINDV